ncbi:hypothetical protein [Halodesulfovibrio sp.]|jgi:hypothetical protein|uniref:hypothetical protein n=1 Tax=Halodesulfovibrio sp. TaxID=1912772 RepID=UPI0025D4027A|nr:hypothetical protein [Halodesulfovibrio sp.]MCT4626959.1 hypothetical protein [Halodesulfovibrio sp.]
MKKNSIGVLFFVVTWCCLQSLSFAASAAQEKITCRPITVAVPKTVFYAPDTFHDGSFVTKDALKKAFSTTMVAHYAKDNSVSKYKTYSIFSELKPTWAGDNSAAVTLNQYLYENGKVLDSTSTTYIFNVQYKHDKDKKRFEVRCIVNDMAVEAVSTAQRKIYDKLYGVVFWPQDENRQDEHVLKFFVRAMQTFAKNSVQTQKVVNLHYEAVTALGTQHIRQLLQQEIPAMHSSLRVTEEGVYWGDALIVTVTPQGSLHKITVNFDAHYVITPDAQMVLKKDTIPLEYLRKTVQYVLPRGTYIEENVEAIHKRPVAELFK